MTVKQDTGVLDIVGSFFYNAYKVLIQIPKTFDTFTEMTEQASSDLPTGSGFDILKNGFITIVMILIFIGVILAILIKGDVI
jgi:hypothetical protein